MTETTNYLNAGKSLRSWLLTVDHKRTAILYMLAITFFFFVGGAAAVLFRMELLTPKGDLLSADSRRPCSMRWASSACSRSAA